MSDEIASQVGTLIAKAKELPEGAAKRATFDEAIRVADLHQRDQLGYDARMAALWSVYENGDIRLLFAHYAWCLAAADRNPDWDRFQLLWRYRWVIDSMPDTSHIARPQIEAALDDMTRRYAADGYSPRAVFVLRRRVYEFMGDYAKETEAFEQIRLHRRDSMSDEATTEATFAIDYHTLHKRYEQAAKMADVLLAKLPPNDHYSGSTRAEMLFPLLHLGERRKAADYHRVGLRVNTARARNYGSFRTHIEYLALVGELAAAVELVEKHLPAAIPDHNELGRFKFLHTVRFLCDRLTLAGGNPTLKVPQLPGVPTADGRAAVSDLVPYLDAEITGTALRLDTRNGNEHYRQKLKTERPELHALADKLAAAPPLKPEKDSRAKR